MTATLRLLAQPDQEFEWIASLERNRFTLNRFATLQALLAAPSSTDDVIFIRLDQPPVRERPHVAA